MNSDSTSSVTWQQVRQLTGTLTSLTVAVLVLLISLHSASQAQALSNGQGESSRRSIYFGESIKPNHVLYPLVALRDQVEVLLLPTEQRFIEQLNHADSRLTSSAEMAADSGTDLDGIAIATLMKSEQYLIDASVSLNELAQTDPERARELYQLWQNDMDAHLQALPAVKTLVAENYWSQIDKLIDRERQLKTSLAGQLASL
jgi:hypothetical protein